MRGASFQRKRRLLSALAGWLMCVVAGTAGAQAGESAPQPGGYPQRPIRIIAPVAPGGGVDLVARTVAERLSRVLGQPIVVDNQAGGGGIVGSMATAKAAPDGYTLMIGYVGTHGTNPAVRKLPYDAVRDFTPVAMVGGTPNVLVVPTSMPVSNLEEFVALAKSGKQAMSYGSSGPGTLTHLAMEQFRSATGVEMPHAPYRGIGPALVDLIGGQTQALFPGLAAALPHIRAGKLKALGVTGLARHPLLPDVPTFEEQKYAGFDGVQWYGIVGPAKMPAAITRKLNDEINALLGSPELKQKLSGEALEPMPMSAEKFGEYMRADIARWTELATQRNIRLDD